MMTKRVIELTEDILKQLNESQENTDKYKMTQKGDPRWWIGNKIRITEHCDFRNHLKTW
jgi:hypothetical protein